jgi:MSHA pilin protein MshA
LLFVPKVLAHSQWRVFELYFTNKWRKMAMNKSKGFTLIELVIVIVIVGVLSVFAIPKYLEIRSDARAASILTALGAVKAASAMVHALYLAPGGTPGFVTMDGVVINIVNGYAASTAPGIALAAGISDGGGVTGTYSVAITAGSTTISINGAPGSCQVVYNIAASVSTPPLITYATGGC